MVSVVITVNMGTATAIPAQYHVQASSAIPDTTAPHADSPVFDQETRQWKATVFPTQLPSTREEVLHLTRVLDILLKEVDASRRSPDHQPSQHSGEESGTCIRLCAQSGEYLNICCSRVTAAILQSCRRSSGKL